MIWPFRREPSWTDYRYPRTIHALALQPRASRSRAVIGGACIAFVARLLGRL